MLHLSGRLVRLARAAVTKVVPHIGRLTARPPGESTPTGLSDVFAVKESRAIPVRAGTLANCGAILRRRVTDAGAALLAIMMLLLSASASLAASDGCTAANNGELNVTQIIILRLGEVVVDLSASVIS